MPSSIDDIPTEIKIYDFLGRLVKNVTTKQNTIKINLEDFASGSYFFKIKNNQKLFIKIIIKE